MDSMVEENGNSSLDPLALPLSSVSVTATTQSDNSNNSGGSGGIVSVGGSGSSGGGSGSIVSGSSSGGNITVSPAVLASSIVQILPTQATSVQAQSVIQANQQSVIQTATNMQPMISKGVVLVNNKPNSVIHTTPVNLQSLQIKPEPNTTQLGVSEINSEDSLTDDDTSPRKRRDLLTRRPSYRKILNDLGGGEITVISTGTLVQGGDTTSLHTIPSTGSGGGTTIVQYNQDGQFYVPDILIDDGSDVDDDYEDGMEVTLGNSVLAEDQSRKREQRLLKNREAARECRRKKKEYIKCLENRVAVLENQNKTLIDELKSLKELYCQQKSD